MTTTYYAGDVVTVSRPDWNHGSQRPAFVRSVAADGTLTVVCFSSTVEVGPRIRRDREAGLTRDSWVAATSYRRGGRLVDSTMQMRADEVIRLRGTLDDDQWELCRTECDRQLRRVR